MNPINRREALFRTAYLVGSTLTIPALLSGCQNEPPSPLETWKPTFFSADEGKVVAQISEHIFPGLGEGPGAIDIQVYEFIDHMHQECQSVEEGKAVKAGLAALEAEAQQKHQKAFIDLSAEEQINLLQPLYKASREYDDLDEDERPDLDPYFHTFKWLTFNGVFTSEVGIKSYLAYDPIPGEWKGCISLDETEGKVWAY